jgi:hypothetical protein
LHSDQVSQVEPRVLSGMKKHVRLLEQAELVTMEKVGRVRRCMLVPDHLVQAVERTKGER